VRLSSRSTDDADVIRARLRTVLEQARRPSGWVPDADPPRDAVPLDDEPFDDEPFDDEPFDDEEPADDPVPRELAEDGFGRHRAPGTAVRLAPGRHGVWALAAAGLLAALVLVAWTWLDRPEVAPAPARTGTGVPAVTRSAAPSPSVGEAAATSPTVVVSVVGLVVRPGLVTVPSGARVADAVAAAGGLRPDADPASVNMAAVVSDGQQIAVGVPGAAADPGASAGPAASGPVNLNTATAAQLDALPGIGPVLAQRIVDYRTQQGRFTSVDQLDDVPGIGPALYGRLSGSVTV
jgi:competence protein ComEA